VLEEEATSDKLKWDPTRESRIELGSPTHSTTTTLGIIINSKLDWMPHIKSRTKKALQIKNVMTRLGNSNGGLSPAAMRSLYTGMIRPIFTWGAQVWNGTHSTTNISEMERLEYQALRKITGGYHGSSKAKVDFIAAVEPLQVILDDLSASWAARSLRAGDKMIRRLADEPPTWGTTAWYDGTGQNGWKTDSPITSASFSALSNPFFRVKV